MFSCWGGFSSLMKNKVTKGISKNVTRRKHFSLVQTLKKNVVLWKHIGFKLKMIFQIRFFENRLNILPQTGSFNSPKQSFLYIYSKPCKFPNTVEVNWFENAAEFGWNILHRIAFKLNSSQDAVFSHCAHEMQQIKCIFTPWKKQSNDSPQKCFLI